MNTLIERKRLAGKLRGAALAAALAGVAVASVSVPALAQDSWRTQRTVRTYNYGYDPGYNYGYYPGYSYYPSGTTTYYGWGPSYDYYDYGYAYPPPAYYGPGPGVTVGVPGFGVHVW